MKIYKSKCILGYNLVLADGKRKYVLFDGMSNGDAILSVKTPAVAEALEKLEDYGKNFYLYMDDEKEGSEAEREIVKGRKAKKEDPAADAAGAGAEDGAEEDEEPAGEAAEEAQPYMAANETEEPAGEAAGTGAEVKEFECFDDAREYVHEKWGVPKKKLMSKSAVKAVGEEHGEEIVILN